MTVVDVVRSPVEYSAGYLLGSRILTSRQSQRVSSERITYYFTSVLKDKSLNH